MRYFDFPNFTYTQIPATTTRILLNHFKWDKEKLMEKYYDGDQETFFKEAHVINPFNKPNVITRPKAKKSGTEECEICFSFFPPTVSSTSSRPLPDGLMHHMRITTNSNFLSSFRCRWWADWSVDISFAHIVGVNIWQQKLWKKVWVSRYRAQHMVVI